MMSKMQIRVHAWQTAAACLSTLSRTLSRAGRRWGIRDRKLLGARSAFGTLLALASLFVPTLMMSREARADATDHSACSMFAGQPQEVQDFVNTQCQLHATLFGDGTEPSISYLMDAAPEAIGTYTGTSFDGHQISFDVVHVVASKHNNDGTPNYPQTLDGQTTYSLIGTITGTVGKAHVFAVGFNLQSIGGGDEWRMLVCKIVQDADINRVRQMNRITAGVQVMSLVTLQSMPLNSDLQLGNVGLSANINDLSTIFSKGPLAQRAASSGTPQGEDQIECMIAAFERYMRAAKFAQQSFNQQIKNLTVNHAMAVAGCILLGGGIAFFTLGIGVLAGTVCAALALANYIKQCGDAVDAFTATLRFLMDELIADLQACGIAVANQ